MTRGEGCCERGGGGGQVHQRASAHLLYMPRSHPPFPAGDRGCPWDAPLWAVLCSNTVLFLQGQKALPGIGAEEGAVVLISPHWQVGVVSGQRRTSDMASSLCPSLAWPENTQRGQKGQTEVTASQEMLWKLLSFLLIRLWELSKCWHKGRKAYSSLGQGLGVRLRLEDRKEGDGGLRVGVRGNSDSAGKAGLGHTHCPLFPQLKICVHLA